MSSTGKIRRIDLAGNAPTAALPPKSPFAIGAAPPWAAGGPARVAVGDRGDPILRIASFFSWIMAAGRVYSPIGHEL